MGVALIWLRRDLRLDDHPALQAALDRRLAPIFVYVHAPAEEGAWAPGAASRTWLHRSLVALDGTLRRRGSRLILRQGRSLEELETLARETHASAVFWNRCYEAAAMSRDSKVETALRGKGLVVESFAGSLLAEPWTVATKQGQPYRVFRPFWNPIRRRLDEQGELPSAPTTLPPPPSTVRSLDVKELGLEPPPHEPPWDLGFWDHWTPGEDGARQALARFLEGGLERYAVLRDFPAERGTSRLSPHLHFGEISPRRVASEVLAQRTASPDTERFLQELGWRDFSYHLLFHHPEGVERNLNPRFERFEWAEPDPHLLRRWQRGKTGIPIVDAGMRQLWTMGWMHNRVRMLVASLLTKNLRYHWWHGARWFWDTLVDADLANNTEGWQWTAGTGIDAAPFFRIFNPVTQARRYDPEARYIRHWLPELQSLPLSMVFAPWEHREARRLAPDYPSEPIVDLAQSRKQALEAFEAIR